MSLNPARNDRCPNLSWRYDRHEDKECYCELTNLPCCPPADAKARELCAEKTHERMMKLWKNGEIL